MFSLLLKDLISDFYFTGVMVGCLLENITAARNKFTTANNEWYTANNSARPRAAKYTIGIYKEKAKKPKVSK